MFISGILRGRSGRWLGGIIKVCEGSSEGSEGRERKYSGIGYAGFSWRSCSKALAPRLPGFAGLSRYYAFIAAPRSSGDPDVPARRRRPRGVRCILAALTGVKKMTARGRAFLTGSVPTAPPTGKNRPLFFVAQCKQKDLYPLRLYNF